MNSGGRLLAWSRVRLRDLVWRIFSPLLRHFFSFLLLEQIKLLELPLLKRFFSLLFHIFFPAWDRCWPNKKAKHQTNVLCVLVFSFFPSFSSRLIQFNKFLRPEERASIKWQKLSRTRVEENLLPLFDVSLSRDLSLPFEWIELLASSRYCGPPLVVDGGTWANWNAN